MTTVDPGQQPAPFLHFENFLDQHEVEALLRFVVEHEQELRPSGVTTATSSERPEDIRRSRTLVDCEPIWPLFDDRLTNLLPITRRELGVGHFPLDRIERQLTLHFDGDFFGPHNDSGGPDVATRRMTYVYYFGFEPRRFRGGDLRLYHSIDDRGSKLQGTDFVTVDPTPNSIVFFPSWVHHEVRKVHTEAPGVEAARMTVTGWFHQTSAPPPLQAHPNGEDQPPATQFTSRGFDVVATPAAVHEALVGALQANRDKVRLEAPDPDFLPSGEPELTPIGALGDWVAEQLQELHESWAGRNLRHTATYGIRTYRNGQTLAQHRDREQTHIVSSVVHIEHDGPPWPLVIEDHQGRSHEVVLQAGEMLLYEGASCRHGRPEPFLGTHFSNVFVHFCPAET